MNFSLETLLALIAILVQTGALFYWGGGVRQILKDHERRIGGLEKSTDRQIRTSES
jgi:hypothetical protein